MKTKAKGWERHSGEAFSQAQVSSAALQGHTALYLSIVIVICHLRAKHRVCRLGADILLALTSGCSSRLEEGSCSCHHGGSHGGP